MYSFLVLFSSATLLVMIMASTPVKGKIQFLVNEKIEIRSTENGNVGSWHRATIVNSDEQSCYFQCDNSPERLPEVVSKRSGRLRPLPPEIRFDNMELSYGMCVDLYQMDAWWEGVILDQCQDGSGERVVLVPGLSRQVEAGVEILRISQDWDECAGVWKCRGTWPLLEWIGECKLKLQDWQSEVFAKETWGLMKEKLGDWACNVKPIWPELAREISSDPKPYLDGPSLNLHAALMESRVLLPGTDRMINVAYSDAVSADSSLFSTIENSLEGEIVLHSNADPVTKGEQLSRISTHKLERKLGDSRHKDSSPWLPVGPDMFNKVEFCPRAITEFASLCDNKPPESLVVKVRMHLLRVGWKIERMKYKNSFRYKYISPDKSEIYLSLRQLCHNLRHSVTKNCNSPAYLIEEDSTNDTKESSNGAQQREKKRKAERPLFSFEVDCTEDAIGLTNNTGLTHDQDQNVSFTEPKSRKKWPLLKKLSEDSNPWLPVVLDMLPRVEFCAGVITEFASLGDDKKPRESLAIKVRTHLLHLGWKIERSKCKNSYRYKYISPDESEIYYSLRQLCLDLKDSVMKNGKCPTELTKKGSPNDTKESHVGARPREMKRKAEMPTLSLEVDCTEDTVGSVINSGLRHDQDQNISFPKPKRGKKRPLLKKLIEQSKITVSNCTRRSTKRVRQQVSRSSSNSNPLTILSWLIDNDIVLPRTGVHCCNGENPLRLKKGKITRCGVKCYCCQRTFTPSEFEAHAGSTRHRPAANIILKDGRSLLDCQMEMLDQCPRNLQQLASEPKSKEHDSDAICSICRNGGDLILCDQCPSSFHQDCLGLKDLPEGDWFCPSCLCGICGRCNLEENHRQSKGDSVLVCHQCWHKYHVGCLRNERQARHNREDHAGNWFCSSSCMDVFLGLENLVGKRIVCGVGLTWTLMKSMQSDNCELNLWSENQCKLNLALQVMSECFEPLKEAYTGRDIFEDVIFSRGSVLNRLNFVGFYTVLLEKNDELVTVANVRVLGDKVAEMPLIGTRFQYRGRGMCTSLMDELEKQLMKLGVERLILPATPSALDTWIRAFGFSKLAESDRNQYLDCNFLNFPGTTLCQKVLQAEVPNPV